MRQFLLYCIITLYIIFPNSLEAATIIYPQSEISTIDSDVTFFIGNGNPDSGLKINSEQVKIHRSGGFFYPVKLQSGENIFKIEDNENSQIYKIYRPEKSIQATNKESNKIYKEPEIYIVNKNNVPLRSTPINYGINRLQHFDNGVELKVIGEYENYYEVQLARDDYAWINKDYVKKAEENTYQPAKIFAFAYDEFQQKTIYHIKLNKKVPYILSERITYNWNDNQTKLLPKFNGLDLVVYNVEGYPENKYEYFINNSNNRLKGYKSYYNSDDELIIEIIKAPIVDITNPLNGINITIDPGHGGREYGTTGCHGNKEKNINLAIAFKLKDYLQNAGANVYMTRADDSDLSLQDRVLYSQNSNSDIFISIHNNAIPDSEANNNHIGSSVYYYSIRSKRLAAAILKRLTEELGMADDGLKQRSFAVLRNTESLCVLIEIGYLIKPEDNEKLLDSAFQDQAAKAIMHGLEDYLSGIQK